VKIAFETLPKAPFILLGISNKVADNIIRDGKNRNYQCIIIYDALKGREEAQMTCETLRANVLNTSKEDWLGESTNALEVH
jgi:hypothetical protein